MKTLLLLLVCCHVSSAVNHTLEFFITSSNGITDFPDFVAFVKVDDSTIVFCDGKTVHPKYEWVKKMFEDDPEHQYLYTQNCLNHLQFLRENIDIIVERNNQTGGPHMVQIIAGCDWDDKTGGFVGFSRYGYDGEDFISLDPQEMSWIALTPKALVTKHIWNNNKAWFRESTATVFYNCPQWIKKYLEYRRNFIKQTGNTSVSLLQKSPSSPVSCFATGFYPSKAVMFWKKEGKKLHEDVEHGEILPNHDDTFQMSVNLSISAVKPEDWGMYECVFQLDGVKEDIITKLDKAVIRSNYESPPGPPVAAVTGVVAGLFLLSVCILGLLMLRRRNNGFQPANRGQEQSEDTPQVQ